MTVTICRAREPSSTNRSASSRNTVQSGLMVQPPH
jgi:hypothetical protein